jgi:methionine-R-sulfoxide reductase
MKHSTTRTDRAALALAAALCALCALCALGARGAGAAAAGPTSSLSTKEEREMSHYQKPTDDQLRKSLTREQYEVTQHDGTEAPFHNAYWDNHRPGIYVDVVSGEPLFSSLDKFDSGTGWPSFTRPIGPDHITTRTDHKLLLPRTEVRSRLAGSHLGHVFEDGPAPAGLRYCMNSAALRFVPVERLAEEGYGKYLKLFAQHGGEAAARGGTNP